MIPINFKILDNTMYNQSPLEELRFSLFSYLNNNKVFRSLMQKANNFDEIGKNGNCYWSEALFYFDLIDYFILIYKDALQHEYICGTEDFDALIATYELTCIQRTLLCRYGSSGIVDGLKNNLIATLYKRANFCCESGVGIGFMQISGNNCSVFTQYPLV